MNAGSKDKTTKSRRRKADVFIKRGRLSEITSYAQRKIDSTRITSLFPTLLPLFRHFCPFSDRPPFVAACTRSPAMVVLQLHGFGSVRLGILFRGLFSTEFRRPSRQAGHWI